MRAEVGMTPTRSYGRTISLGLVVTLPVPKPMVKNNDVSE